MDTWMLVLGDKAEISWCSVFEISEGQRAGKKERAKKETRRRYQKRKQVLILERGIKNRRRKNIKKIEQKKKIHDILFRLPPNLT